MRRDLKRMARLRAEGMSFGAAVVLGLGLGSAKPRRRDHIQYNGAGLAGDQEAIGRDFTIAIDAAKQAIRNRGR